MPSCFLFAVHINIQPESENTNFKLNVIKKSSLQFKEEGKINQISTITCNLCFCKFKFLLSLCVFLIDFYVFITLNLYLNPGSHKCCQKEQRRIYENQNQRKMFDLIIKLVVRVYF